MRTDRLERAISAIHVRYGGQSLVRAARLPEIRPWSTGQPALDGLSGVGGLPQGRLSVLQGPPGSGKLTLALAMLARATHEFARPVVLDPRRGFEPWTLDAFGADPTTLTVVRPPGPPGGPATGEAAVALARAGSGFLLALGPLPEPALASLESAAARSGCLVVAIAEQGIGEELSSRALAHASSLTFQVEPAGWFEERQQVVGMRARVSCVKNRLAAPGDVVEVEIRYPLGARLFPGPPLRLAADSGRVPAEPEGERWLGRSAAG